MKKVILATMLLFLGRVFAQESILLNTPYDGDTIYTHHPLLTWSILGGLPVNNDREYYQITIVELQDNQDAASGVMVNTPLVRMDHLSQNQLFYPYDAPELQEGKRYGWQVQKITNNVVSCSSEAWEFILGFPPDIEPVYYKMKLKADGTICPTQNGKFYFEFNEHYNDEELDISLYNDQHQKINVAAIFNQEEGQYALETNVKRTGINLYELNLGSNISSGIYRLVLLGAKKQSYELTFEVQ